MENIYIKAMEYGYNNPQGFEYTELKDNIEGQLKLSLNQDAEYGLVEWFIESFTSVDNYSHSHKNGLLEAFRLNNENTSMQRFLNSTWIIRGLTTKQYIDYLELKESRENSNRAFKTSIGSIVIALASVVISWYLSFNSPKPIAPPYDVKIIEDKTSTKQLEKEVMELEEKLFQAELLIEVYENP